MNKVLGNDMKPVTVLAVGDISLQTLGNHAPFDRIMGVLEEAAVLFGNLKTVLSNRGTLSEKAVTLSSLPDRTRYLTAAGFDLLNVANIEKGATVILGNHPHVVQGIERYKDRLIAYSLGNSQFAFDPRECAGKHSKKTNHSIILKVELERNGVRSFSVIPVEKIVGKDE